MLNQHVKNTYRAADGKEGLELYMQERPDIVITDFNMPEMNGLEMAFAISAIDGNTPIIITTAFTETELLTKSIEIGISHFVFKPIEQEKLYRALFSAAEKVRMQKTIEDQQQKLAAKVKELQEANYSLKAKEKIIRDDLMLARRIQGSVLPRESISISGLKFCIRYLPMYDVGGDIYDIMELPDGRIRIFLADAMGHGIQAALVTMLIKSEYEKAKALLDRPEEIFWIMNSVFCGIAYKALSVFLQA